MNLSFSEYRPSLALAPFVQTYWQGHFNLSGEKDFIRRVVPNGCIELIIHLTDANCQLTARGEEWQTSPDFTLVGLYTQPYEVQFATEVQVFGIRFFPDGIRHIFGVPPVEFIATYEDSIDVLGAELSAFCARIREEQAAAAQVQLSDSFLEKQLAIHHQLHDYTHQAMQLIRQESLGSDYQQLTAQVPISDRQLQRRFKTQYGITVSEYMRLSRMNAVQNYMLNAEQNLTELTYELQFSDQSHFIREFKHYVGMAPGKFRKHRDAFIVNPAVAAAS
jgi:AraC-like DNA-binding protein